MSVLPNRVTEGDSDVLKTCEGRTHSVSLSTERPGSGFGRNPTRSLGGPHVVRPSTQNTKLKDRQDYKNLLGHRNMCHRDESLTIFKNRPVFGQLSRTSTHSVPSEASRRGPTSPLRSVGVAESAHYSEQTCGVVGSGPRRLMCRPQTSSGPPDTKVPDS